MKNLILKAVEEPPQPKYVYWTYEGSRVKYDTASPKYTEANKSQIPKNFYIKTIATPSQATVDNPIYEVKISEDSGETYINFGNFTTLSLSDFETTVLGGTKLTCDGTTETDLGSGTKLKCITHTNNYEAELISSHQVCANFNSEVCFVAGEYDGKMPQQ